MNPLANHYIAVGAMYKNKLLMKLIHACITIKSLDNFIDNSLIK